MNDLKETVLQLGAGRFLRAFADRFIHQANEAGQKVGRVVVVQSTPGKRAELLNQQPDGYDVLVRGYQEGNTIDRVEHVNSISRALVATEQWPQILEFARSPDLRYIISNSTEAGYALENSDQLDSTPPQCMPAKLTRLLWERFQAEQAAPVILPCELFERNASRLVELIAEQIRSWSLPADFEDWVRKECWWLDNLVDCIITDAPTDHPLAAKDKLLVVAEPYFLWAIEKPADREPPLFTHPAIHVVDDVTPFYLRKVRILNGLHTAMVAKFLPLGFETVLDVMQNRDALNWVRGILFEEILPALAYRVDDTAQFASQTLDRFCNPFSKHRLEVISLHHADKVKLRLETTRSEYQKLFSKQPRRLVEAIESKIAPKSA